MTATSPPRTTARTGRRLDFSAARDNDPKWPVAYDRIRRRSTPMPILTPGTTAPDFTLHRSPDELLSLRELRGRPVVLAFYPADWSPVCGDQLVLYNECLDMFDEHSGAQLLGISVDGVWCHQAYAEHRKL